MRCSTDVSIQIDPGLAQLGLRVVGQLREKRVRPISQFAAEEIIVQTGRHSNTRYKPDRKPASRLWFNEIESGRWITHVYTGPVQSGKSLDAFVIPILWCLFEKEENVIVGLPDMGLSSAKWLEDLKPMIEASRYAKFLPTKGPGSRGGDVEEVRFTNGVSLIFMSFGGGDKSRAARTAQNLIITETDGANEVSEKSDEGTKIDQLIGRTMSFDSDAFIIMECTLSTNLGITYQEIIKGSNSRILKECPHCSKMVAPERGDFRGWETASSEIEAGECGRFHCPECGESWSDEQRAESLKTSILLHKGQAIGKDGSIIGRIPETTTLGFRVAAIDNVFRSSKYLSQICWKIERREDQEAARRTLLQQQFAEPFVAKEDEEPRLDPYTTSRRILKGCRRGIVPAGYDTITVGTDLRATQLHGVVGAWQPNATPHVLNYGKFKVFSRTMGRERALLQALRYYRESFLSGGFIDNSGQVHHVAQWWIDAGWETKTVYKFIRECWSDSRWENVVFPYVGRGVGKQYKGNYNHPTLLSNAVAEIGEEFHVRRDLSERVYRVICNADHWKSKVHSRLRIPILDDDGEVTPGAMTLFQPDDGDHTEIVRHWTAEHEEDIDGVKRFVTTSTVNHFFDATYAMTAAAARCGITATQEVIDQMAMAETDYQIQEEEKDAGLVMPDGRPFTY